MSTVRTTRPGSAGFTLIETLFAVAILGLLAVYAVMKLATPATMTLEAQACSLADLVRRAQSLAMARGQRMSVSVASLTVSQDAVVKVVKAVDMPNFFIYFNTLGQPVDKDGTPESNDASFTLSYTTLGRTETYTVTVAALTGRVSVSP